MAGFEGQRGSSVFNWFSSKCLLSIIQEVSGGCFQICVGAQLRDGDEEVG